MSHHPQLKEKVVGSWRLLVGEKKNNAFALFTNQQPPTANHLEKEMLPWRRVRSFHGCGG
jgi:hypothetical protein